MAVGAAAPNFFNKSPFDMVPAGGKLQKCTYNFAAVQKEMWYLLYTPSCLNLKDGKASTTRRSKQSLPLVVALHGLFCGPNHIMNFDGLMLEAERRGYLVVAPMGYNNHAWYGCFENLKLKKHDPSEDDNQGYRSEQDVLNVVDEIRRQFPVDAHRIYLTGHSMGGAGTVHLGAKYPMLWAAVAPLSPALPFQDPEKKCSQLKELPVYMATGDKDPVCRIDGVRQWIRLLKGMGATCELLTLEGDHLAPSMQAHCFTKIFDFFDTHPRSSPAPPSVLAKPLDCDNGGAVAVAAGRGRGADHRCSGCFEAFKAFFSKRS
mmetsp:Transcript_10403/g.23543  ORF Transcript_10403/g.23543 Transcript_10403/m.23543 type:complete len:318 (+) Transcript_10403:115-1068(+)|eukprot:CAMPEP_0178416924 /NCGR_PEP_ID=MMETSP0689_2-20121128/24313_1 /TAXON_ID=160604 /ORGANISM="Amphidinium massartii, Strain CS-259" /LENGTH=317 /DNA_ID=CAMNT_0020038281 /DNA_START=114 /DNA_END=1067 /DNA_ORIENTATION=-